MTQGLDITIKLNEDFISQYNKLQNEYGAYMSEINGLGYNQLSYTNFIDNFIDHDTVADASVDGNSNVSHKDIVTLEREMSKPHMKLIGFNKIYYEIEKSFGFYMANKWLTYEWIGKLYLHDGDTATKKPYSYRGSETVVVKYKGSAPKLINMSELYELVDEPEEILCEEDNAFCKYTNDLVVQDSEGWVKVSRVIRHDKTNKFHFIKLQNGLTKVVTDNHPLITMNRGDIDAKDVEIEKDSLMTFAPDIEFGGETEIYVTKELKDKGYGILFNGFPATEDSYDKDGQISYMYGSSFLRNKIKIDYDFGWLLGFILGVGDGTFIEDNSSDRGKVIAITQRKNKYMDKLIEVLNKFNLGYTVRQTGISMADNPMYLITIRERLFCDIIFSLFLTRENQYTRHLNPDIMRFNKDFIKGIIGGVIDSDGSIAPSNSRIVIRMASRHLLQQLGYLIRMFGYNTREALPKVMNFAKMSERAIKSRRYIYTLAVTPYSNREVFSSIKISENIYSIHTYEEAAHCRNNKYTIGYDEQLIANNMELNDEFDGEDYVYDITTETGHFICNGILSHNCFAYTLKEVAEKGLFFIEGRSSLPAKHLITFVDFVKEFINYNSNRTSGACGLPDLIPYMFYFWKKDVENDYLGIRTSHNEEYYAKQGFQRFIFAVNQPYTRDGSQSAFTNTSIFDHKYFEALFGGSEFPDGTFMIDYEEEIINFQKWYMEVMSEIRSENMFTFPVSSISLLKNKDNEFEDPEFAEWAIKHNMKWSDSNLFIDNSVTSLSNCCFSANQMCLSKLSNGVNYMSFKDLYESSYNKTKRNFTIYHNGSWVGGKLIRLPSRPMYKIVTSNKKEVIVTDNHIFPTLEGDKQAIDITENDYLLFSNRKLDTFKEVDEKLTYDEGFLIGMYLGNGSMSQRKGSKASVQLSLNKEKYESGIERVNSAISKYDKDAIARLHKPYNNVYPVQIFSNQVAEFIRRWVYGNYAFEKELNMDVLLQSYDFRKGILDGYYLTDGGNSNRIYSTSESLIHNIEVLISSLGMNSVIDVNDRRDEPVVIRGVEYKHNFHLWCIRWYDQGNRRTDKNDGFILRNNCEYYKVESIEEVEYNDKYVYCFEMANENEPYFTLPNGIITHNCRLKSDISNLGYFNSIGGTALKVGSVKVNTINLARIALESETEEEYLENLRDTTYICLITLDRVRHIIKRNVEKHLLPNFSHGIIDFEHLYNTIGFIGIYETMKKFGYTTTDEFGNVYYTDDAFRFGENIFKEMRKVSDEFIKKYNCDYQINTEQIPGESAADKLMRKDKFFYGDANIYDLPLYGNQFIPLGIQTTMKERVKIAAAFDSYCNGGSILHYNIDAPFDSYEKAYEAVKYIMSAGVTYFAFNTKIQVCEDNHAFFGNVCPKCGKPVSAEYTRIVGFYTKIQSWSSKRKEEYKMRKWANSQETHEMVEKER